MHFSNPAPFIPGVELIAHATPKRHYYYASPLGRRLIDLGLGPLALSFVGASGREELQHARTLIAEHGAGWPAAWLDGRGLPEWAERWETWKEGEHGEAHASDG